MQKLLLIKGVRPVFRQAVGLARGGSRPNLGGLRTRFQGSQWNPAYGAVERGSEPPVTPAGEAPPSEQRLADDGVHDVQLSIMIGNDRAMDLYRRRGMVPVLTTVLRLGGRP